MVYLYPRFYNCSVPAAFSADLPQLAQLCADSKPQLSSNKRMEQLFSAGGEKFVSFAKSENFVDGKIPRMPFFKLLGIYLLIVYILEEQTSFL